MPWNLCVCVCARASFSAVTLLLSGERSGRGYLAVISVNLQRIAASLLA